MRLVHALLYLVQWLFYVVRLVFSLTYGLIAFVSKPGSRVIVPSLAAVALFLWREPLYPFALAALQAADLPLEPEPWLLDGLLGVGFILAACGYVLLSRLLAVVLGTFPPVTRPLPPLRRLSAHRRPIRPVIVRQAVPRLRRWRF